MRRRRATPTTTPLTASSRDVRPFLNNNLQFSSRDDYRYHEALVHPGLTAVAHPARVLIFGGGDGLAAREILKHPDVESITRSSSTRRWCGCSPAMPIWPA